MNTETLIRIGIWAVPVLFSIIVHEVSHGYMAYKLGDPTAKMMGRLTLNPIPHLDIVGTVILPIMMIVMGGPVFGWAKPVPFNPFNFYQHVNHRKGTMLVALAGPLSNFTLAFIAGFFLFLSYRYTGNSSLTMLIDAFIYINLYLAVFNLIPIPPLDGSKILMGILPAKYDYLFLKIERYGFFILIFLLMTGAIRALLYPVGLLRNLFLFIPSLIFG